MKKLATALIVLLAVSAKAQTLFHYGNDSVSAQEFIKAWQKNNTGERSEKDFREYLDLYINSKLKILEAKQRGYDTLPQLIADLDNLRQQILPSYLNDTEATTRLVKEAFERSQKDIHLAHIFIGSATHSYNGLDPAFKSRAEEALAALETGKDFSEVARQYSADPYVKENGGDIGWITVFSLPYELENLAYATPVGKHSGLYASKAGYHIFKNLGERRARGKMRAAQILLAFPPGADEKTKQTIRLRADSVYQRLQKGDDFGKLATELSNDVVSAAANGQMQEFGIGQYNQSFENAAFGLTTDGAYTKPFLTDHGYHIVKRLSSTTPATKLDESAEQVLQQRVEQSDRMLLVRKALIRKQMKNVSISAISVDRPTLWAYSDSVLNYTPPGRPLPITHSTQLMTVGDRKILAADWISFAQAFRYKTDGSGMKTYPQLLDEFIEALAIDYYQDHLEEYDPEFARQLQEFKEGNLFFEIMQREVWGPAQTDTIALRKYFNENVTKYHWKPSADAVMFYATDEETAKAFRTELIKSPASWSQIASKFSENMAADSSRFELNMIPNPAKVKLKAGVITSPLVNKMDQSASFAYVIRLHSRSSPRSYDEARGMVINDYQAELERKWVAELKEKYPVRVNESLVKDLANSQ